MTNSQNKISELTINLLTEEVLDSLRVGIVVLNTDYLINIMNADFMDMFGYKKDELQNKSINTLFNADEYEVLKEYIKNSFYPKDVLSVEKIKLYGFRQNKSMVPLEITIFHIDENSNKMYLLIMRDISAANQAVGELRNLAYYDQLTNIPNRTLFRDRAQTALRIAQREGGKLAILYIDIDGFKIINDTMGHDAGDILLKELAHRFQKYARDSDTVSRLGGDEFAILMLNITSPKDASILAERILESNIKPIKIKKKDIIPNTSLGISIFPEDGENFDKLMRNADTAMYYAKRKGKNQCIFYKPNMKKEIN